MTKNLDAFNLNLADGSRTTVSLTRFEYEVLKIIANYKDMSVNNYMLMAIKRGELDGLFNRSRSILEQLISDLAKNSCILGFFDNGDRHAR